jgi:EAL domain-containing protein (putative c-di-GMP-specific phosphodiesterase class I)
VLGELLHAIKRREIKLYYQPQIELTSRKIVGLETLVRWQKAADEFVPPMQFIPIAEKTGFIVSLGKWIFDEACKQANRWQEMGVMPATIAVNISPVQCRRPALVEEIRNSLKKWGIKPKAVELELTETVLLEPRSIETIENLRSLGLRIALDDFGTGYSSLSYLAQCEVDRLKIPREFVSKLATHKRHASIVRSIVRLADELGMESIAEGVEDEAQADFLMAIGCRRAQGFLYGRPTDSKITTELLRSQARDSRFDRKH